MHIVPKNQPDPRAVYCAVGTINYGDVDPDGKPVTLIYLKPAISGDEPCDVFNYARTSTDFPHETTADQWFSESQFESYRVLGRNAPLDISNPRRSISSNSSPMSGTIWQSEARRRHR